MKNLNIITDTTANIESLTLNEILIILKKYGYPRCVASKGGWFCKIDVAITPKGVDFEVSSEYNHDSPLNAAYECLDRLKAAMTELQN